MPIQPMPPGASPVFYSHLDEVKYTNLDSSVRPSQMLNVSLRKSDIEVRWRKGDTTIFVRRKNAGNYRIQFSLPYSKPLTFVMKTRSAVRQKLQEIEREIVMYEVSQF